MTNLQKQAVIVGLEKLFNPNGHFSICAIRDLGKLFGFAMSSQQEAMFSLLHCVDYRNMKPGMREALAQEVVGMIRSAGEDIDFSLVFDKPTPSVTTPAKPGFLQRLSGRVN